MNNFALFMSQTNRAICLTYDARTFCSARVVLGNEFHRNWKNLILSKSIMSALFGLILGTALLCGKSFINN